MLSSTLLAAAFYTTTAIAALPSSFSWTSTDALIYAKNDGQGIDGIKDPSIVNVNGTYHVFASTAQESGYSLVYLSFNDFADAESATFHYLDTTPIGTGYRAAPQVFWFEPHNIWYLVFQNGNAAYSTNPDISDPSGWSEPTNFFSSEPTIIANNIGSGSWVDMWTICDDDNCYLFSSDDNGHLYRAQTTLSSFPDGMGNVTIAMEDTSNIYALFEASNVYKVLGGDYLLIVEAIGSDGYRYFRCWTSPSLTGTWTALADTEENPFASHYNVKFSDGTAWTDSISHGEMIRSMTHQRMTIDPSNLRYLYQGVDPSSTADYNSLPWKLGLLTATSNK